MFLNTEIVIQIDVLAAEDDGADFPLPGVDPGEVLGDTGTLDELHLPDRPDARYADNHEYLSGWFLNAQWSMIIVLYVGVSRC